MKPSGKRVVVLIPSRNEGQQVLEVAQSAQPYCDEVVVVDGNSSDGSPERLRAAGFAVLKDNGRGKGDAIRCGLAQIAGDVVVIMDADGSHSGADIPALIEPILADQADMVIGCRMRGGSDEFAGTWELFVRLWGNNFLTMTINTRFGTHLTDTQNGFRAARLGALQGLGLRENKHSIELEMVMRALRARLRVTQVPSHEYCRRAGESSLSVVRQTHVLFLCLVRNLL